MAALSVAPPAPETLDPSLVAANAEPPGALSSTVEYRLPACAAHLSAGQVGELGAELGAIRQRHLDDRGEVDRTYINRIVSWQRRLEVAGRAMLFAGLFPPAFVGGASALGLAKILDNMEIGHNVMHGQYDWMDDPAIHSSVYEWDNATPASQWKHGHNFVHHTYTNIVGKDRDVGYGLLRVTEQQPWRVRDLGNPVFAFVLALMFEYGIALYELEAEKIIDGDKPMDEAKPLLAVIRAKAGAQAKKDYLLFPVLAGPFAPVVASGNLAANVIRNVWSFTIIFCGHFPDGVELFEEEALEGETRSRWYLRQMLGSANLTGSPTFHILTGNLSFQIEHHLFPDLPARRYQAIANEVRELCERYELPYNTGPLHGQFGTVVRNIVRLSLPDALRGHRDQAAPTERRGLVRRLTAPVSATIDTLADIGAGRRAA